MNKNTSDGRTMYQIAHELKHNEIFALTTERLRLSVLKKGAAPEVTDYLTRNRAFQAKWSQTHSDSYFTEQVQRRYIKYDTREFVQGRLLPLWITTSDDPGRIIGRVSMFNFAYGGMMSCSAGYHLDESEQGKGYMHEALTATVDYLFKELKMHRVEAFILPENERSLRLIKRCGFVEEGIRTSYMHINGQWRDHISFYILEDFLRNVT